MKTTKKHVAYVVIVEKFIKMRYMKNYYWLLGSIFKIVRKLINDGMLEFEFFNFKNNKKIFESIIIKLHVNFVFLFRR